MPSEITIIRTRITTPRRRSDLVDRPRLLRLLSELVEKRLTLVSAPAGYGKTSLLVDFASSSRMPVCWYAIDRLDFDPQRFISYFTAALRQKFPEFGNRTAAALSGYQGQLDLEHITTVLVNDLYDHVPEHFVIVLDDFHLVNDSLQVRNFICKFLEVVEENCHLVITSRSLLALPVLTTLAARSDVGGISLDELSFTVDDIRQMYSQNQHQILSYEAAEDIQKRTEGWITGIILASQVNQHIGEARARLARVSGFGLEEYFLQIINTLPDDLRRFLLWSSLLEEFNAQRCQDIIGTALPEESFLWLEWMDDIQQNNLFVLPIGDQGDWLRYHPLFLDFLQNRARREIPVEALKIEFSLARNCRENNDWDRAFSIYHRINAIDELTGLIEDASTDLIAGGRLATISAWLDALPGDVLNTRPFIVALQGYVAMALGDPGLAQTLYNQAVNAMRLPEDRVLLARTLAMRATLLRIKGNLPDAIADATECMAIIKNDLDMRKIGGDALRLIGQCNFHQGKLHDALDNFSEALSVMASIQDLKSTAILHLELGAVYENLGNYAASLKEYQAALDYWKKVDNPIWLSNLLNNLGVIQQMTGDYVQASQSFEQAYVYAHNSGYARMESFVLTGIGDIYFDLQAYEQAGQAYLLAEGVANRAQEHFLQIYIRMQQASLAGISGEFESGYALIRQARKMLTAQSSEMEHRLCELEYAGLMILENRLEGVIPLLEEVLHYFQQAGHKVQQEKAYLYLVFAYQMAEKPEKVLENLLKLTVNLAGNDPSSALTAITARYSDRLQKCHMGVANENVTRLFQLVEEFKKNLPALRRYLREHARSVPFAPPTILIHALGKMQVFIGKHLVSNSEWQTQAARDLFFLLLAHPEGMTKEEISLIFWPDATPDEARFRFKNTVYRLRRALGKDSVVLDQDIYRFNNSLDYDYDVELFLKENAMALQTQDPLQQLAHFREALKYYRGKYLPDIDETWVHVPRENLYQAYMSILLQVSEIYFNQANYDLALDFCQRTLNEDILLEEAHRMALRIYAAMGNRAGMVRQYQRCVEIFEREINSEPSSQTQALYHDLLR